MKKANNPLQSAALIALFVMGGKILGFLREMVIAREFGATMVTDAFRASQTIPALLFAAIGAALTTTIIPVFTRVRADQGEAAANRFANNLLTALAALCAALVLLGMLAAPLLVRLVVPGFRGARYALTVNLTRIMMAALLWVMLTSLLTGLLQARRRFLAPALNALPLNIIVIGGTLLLSRRLGGRALAYSFVLGSLAQFLWLLPPLWRAGFRPRPFLALSDPGLRRVAVLTLPVLLGTAIQQINVIFDRTFASHLPTGSISVLEYANRLDGLVLNVVIGAVATVAYPSLAEAAAGGDPVHLRATFAKAMRGVNFLVVPLTAGLIALSGPVTRFVYERGAFTPADTARTAQALIFLSVGLLAYGMREITARTFFSLQDTRTPMINGAYTVLINLALLTLLVPVLKLGVPGMAAATSASGLLGTGMLLWRLRRKTGILDGRAVALAFLRACLAAAGMAAAVRFLHPLMQRLVPGMDMPRQALQLGAVIAAGGLVYGSLSLLLGSEESRQAARLFRRLAFGPRAGGSPVPAGNAEAAAAGGGRAEP